MPTPENAPRQEHPITPAMWENIDIGSQGDAVLASELEEAALSPSVQKFFHSPLRPPADALEVEETIVPVVPNNL